MEHGCAWSAVSHLAQAWSALLASPLLNWCDRCLVPLAWGLMAGGRGFASHGGCTSV